MAAHTYGQTIREAARGALRKRIDGDVTLAELTAAIDLAVLAGLHDELDYLAALIEQQAAATSDVWLLARALPPLLQVGRYTSLRVQDTSHLHRLIEKLIPQLAAGLPPACNNIDEEQAYEAFSILKKLAPALVLLERPDLQGLWLAALERVIHGIQVSPLLAGFALRTLVDNGEPSVRHAHNDGEGRLPKLATSMLGAGLSAGVELRNSALMAEGFLYSGGLVLLHQREIFTLLDRWVNSLVPEDFRSILPALRRTFGQFGQDVRRKLKALATQLDASVDDVANLTEAPIEVREVEPNVLDAALGRWLAPQAEGAV